VNRVISGDPAAVEAAAGSCARRVRSWDGYDYFRRIN
jgi:hypothetical protein